MAGKNGLLGRLFGKAAPAIPAPHIPAGRRIYAIGDIHGRNDLFRDLLGRIEADNAGRPAADMQIILLGDLVDRGPDSKGVVETALRLKQAQPDSIFLMGNHEEIFLAALDAPDNRLMRFFLRIGGLETLCSYAAGLDRDEVAGMSMSRLTEILAQSVPSEHRSFLASFSDMEIIGSYAFVHAGVRPGIDLEEQTARDLRWIRQEFLEHRGGFDRIIVHGHHIHENAHLGPDRIGIDTGAFASGRLTAIALEDDRQWLIQTEKDLAQI